MTICMYTTYGRDGVPFFKCQRPATSTFGTLDGGVAVLCASHVGLAASLGCRA